MARSSIRLIVTLGFVLGLIVTSGCGGGGGKTPEKTVENFFEATKAKDIDKMLKCLSPELREVFEEMIEVQGKDTVRKQLAAGKENIGKLKIVDTKITGDTAEVKTSVVVDGKKQEDTLPLRKVKGVWYIDLPEEAKEGLEEMKKMLKDPKMREMMKKAAEGAE
jgi:ketosteroid isomerase-like protein